MINKTIDVIIPVYNIEYDLFFRCMSSIAMQTLRKEIQVTVVDDASSNKEFLNVIEVFKNNLDIQVITAKQNDGPASARQIGIDNTHNDFLVFIDADDSFSSIYSLQILKSGLLSNDNFIMCIGDFDEIHELNDGAIKSFNHHDSIVWMHGKIYKRKFLEKYNIRFKEGSRSNEDAGFNMLCKLSATGLSEQIGAISQTVYNWCDNPNSIVRKNNAEFSTSGDKNGSFYGYVDNMIYAITNALKNTDETNHERIYKQITECLFRNYFSYIRSLERDIENSAQFFKWSKKFYQEAYLLIPEEKRLTGNDYSSLFAAVAKFYYNDNQMNETIPKITFNHYLKLLE